jgi:hypothetical protein
MLEWLSDKDQSGAQESSISQNLQDFGVFRSYQEVGIFKDAFVHCFGKYARATM